MPAPKQATPNGLKPHYKVRVVFPGALIHVAAWTEPEVTLNGDGSVTVVADWVSHPDYGDTMSPMFDWTKAVAVTWRYAR